MLVISGMWFNWVYFGNRVFVLFGVSEDGSGYPKRVVAELMPTDITI